MRIIAFIVLLGSLAAAHAQQITATLTFTNAPSDGNTLTFNSDVRTWKTNVATPSSQIKIGADAGANATNFYRHVASSRLLGLSQVKFRSTNIVDLEGSADQAISISMSGTYASLTLTTNDVIGSGVAVYAPLNAGPDSSLATNIASILLKNISDWSTNAFGAGNKAVENLVQTTGNQTISGDKLFNGFNFYTNTVAIAFEGNDTGAPTNGIIFKKTASAISTNTHWIIQGNGFGEPTIVDSGGNYPKELPDSFGGIITYYLLQTYFPMLTDSNLTNHWERNNEFGKITANAGTLTNLYLNTGTASAVAVTNTTSFGKLDVAESIGFRVLTLSSLANGPNAAVPIGNATIVRITSGPSAAFSIDGIAGGFDGRVCIFINETGQDMTFAHQSGSEPTATNRVVSMTGANRSTTGAGAGICVYNSGISRWDLISLEQ